MENVIKFELPSTFNEDVINGNIPNEILSHIANEYSNVNLSSIEIAPHGRLSSRTAITEYKYKLGASKLPNEQRIHKHGTFDYRIEGRHCKIDVYVIFKHPQLSSYLDDAITCAVVAGTLAVIAAVATDGPGMALFYPSWKVCFAAKVGIRTANEFEVELSGEKHCSNWENH